MCKIASWLLTLVSLVLCAQGGQASAQDVKDVILIGRSAGITGPIAARTKPATEAIQAYFDSVNEAGGVNGRRLKLINMDDGNDAKRAGENARKLVTEDKVFALIAQSGGPQTQAVLPVLNEFQVPLIGSTSGADNLRTPNKYLFHLKASYAQEFAKMAEHMQTTGVTRVAVMASDDTASRDAMRGAEGALQKVGLKSQVSIVFKSADAAAAVDQLAKANVQAVILVSLAAPGADLYKEMVKLPVRPQVFAWSILVPEAIYKAVGDKAYGLVVSQTVHSPADRSIGVARDYQDMLKKAKLEDGGYAGFESYIYARVLVEGLKRAGKTPTRAGLISALEGMRDYDLGGDTVTFNGEEHVGRRFVELVIVGRDGRFLH
jgi:ABC-type branched-subunit amino acid transport system substrate-binding protein